MKRLLSETEPAKNWINQFDSKDQAKAELLLNSIKFVSHQEFESFLNTSLCKLAKSRKIAVYPIISPSENEADRFRLLTGTLNASVRVLRRNKKSTAMVEETKYEKRKQYGSEDRVGQILENISRSQSNIEVVPNIKTLFAQRIKKIVLVDDICGTGTRILNFYKSEIPKGLKRYISADLFEVYVVVYAKTTMGEGRIRQKLKKLSKNPDRFISNFQVKDFDPALEEMCAKYAIKYVDRKGLGYKNSLCNIVFEHGCPNNVPEILHRDGEKEKGIKKWNALFPQRSTANNEIKEGFGEHSLGDFSEVLWGFGQNKLALALCDDNKRWLSSENRQIITLLALVNSRKEPKSHMLLSNEDFCMLISQAIEAELLIQNENAYSVTDLGNLVLNKFRKSKQRTSKIDKEISEYYPSQCGGYSCFGNT